MDQTSHRDLAQPLAALVEFVDTWEKTVRTERHSIEPEFKALAGPIIELADRALGSNGPIGENETVS